MLILFVPTFCSIHVGLAATCSHGGHVDANTAPAKVQQGTQTKLAKCREMEDWTILGMAQSLWTLALFLDEGKTGLFPW